MLSKLDRTNFFYKFFPSADSPTDTLLRLNRNCQSYPCQLYPLRVNQLVLGITDFRDLTGGVYKTRERIHRNMADLRLLAIPPSWRRVAASNLNCG